METELIIICIVSFAAGFIDSIAGGGGLIQTPAILTLYPQHPVATLLGTTKIPSLSGTAYASWFYARNTRVDWKLIAFLFPASFMGAFAGSYCITLIDSAFIKPVILVILILVAVYTFLNKNLGIKSRRAAALKTQIAIGSAFGFVIGFYDGMIGPGTGSLFILAFVTLIGMDFLAASAHGKLLNIATNISSIVLFGITGNILYRIAIPMAFCNIAGSVIGSRLAILKGNKFIRIFFLLVVMGTIVRFAWDLV